MIKRTPIKRNVFRQKKCKSCREWFVPTKALQEVCFSYGVKCALDLAQVKIAKKEDKDHRERKKALKPLSYWLKETQKVFNEYIRLRDRFDACISCGTLFTPEWCAGHFRTRGAASQLAFNENNVNRQCNKYCNLELSGNIAGYRPRLIAKIGLEAVEALENDNSLAEFTMEGLEKTRKTYRAKIKEMK